MAFARAIGEYGSVVFIAGNMPMTEIASLLIITKLTQYDYGGAAAIAFVLLRVGGSLLAAACCPVAPTEQPPTASRQQRVPFCFDK